MERASGRKNTLLEVFEARKHRFDVNDGCTVDGFDGANSQPILDDPAYRDAMKAHGVGPVGRSRGKYARKRTVPIRAWMNLKHVASGAVQPSHNDDVVADLKSVQTLCGERAHFKPGVGGALRTLFGRFAARLELGTDHSNRAKLSTLATLHMCRHLYRPVLFGRHQKPL